MARVLLYHILPWSLFLGYLFISTYDNYVEKFGLEFHIFKLATTGICLIIIFYLNYLIVTPWTLLKKRIPLLFVVGCLMIIGVDICLSIAQAWLLDLYLGEDMFFTKTVDYILYGLITPVLFILASTGARLGAQYYQDLHKKQALQQQVTKAELDSLKSQINPHFLFNSLNNIYALTQSKSDLAPDAVLKLSEIMRYILHEAPKAKVSLQQEVEFLNSYISLQQLRMTNPDLIQPQIELPETEYLLSPLLLIPFVENAFKHTDPVNMSNPIRIHLKVLDNTLHFQVVNDIGAIEKDESSGIGIINLKKRLELLYNSAHDIQLIEQDGIYTASLELSLG